MLMKHAGYAWMTITRTLTSEICLIRVNAPEKLIHGAWHDGNSSKLGVWKKNSAGQCREKWGYALSTVLGSSQVSLGVSVSPCFYFLSGDMLALTLVFTFTLLWALQEGVLFCKHKVNACSRILQTQKQLCPTGF